nr:immunoglobulin heavy chain junction region [Mus musculus]MBK4189558.1 immunoglobulin heavy chain junction region [Mus musculus]
CARSLWFYAMDYW